MNNKKFLIAALSLILLFSVSCGDKPTDSGNEKKSSPYAGVWEGGEEKITINSDGSFNINGQYIPASDITKNGNTFSFKNPADGAEYSLTFKSDTEVEFKKNGEQIPLTKNPDKPTGSSPSNPVNIDEIINSIPTTEGKPTATDLNVEAVYTGKLTGSYTTIIGEESGSGEIQGGGTEFILAITNNFIHFGYIDTEYTESPDGNPTSPTKTTRIVLTNAKLYKDGSLYIAGKNEEGIGNFGFELEQLPCKNICYIEFTKPGDNTEIKRAIDATSFESKNFVNKLEYKGTLTKDTSSGSSGS